MSQESQDKKLFDEIACGYSRKDSVVSSAIARKKQLFSALKPVFKSISKLGTIVDIGCGVGAPAKYLAGYYERYVGIDQSEGLIKEAHLFNSDNEKTEFIASNIKSDALPQNSADVVLSIGALHHMTDLGDVMDSIIRMAKSNAVFVAIEPQNSNPLIKLMRYIRKKVDPLYSEDQQFFSEKYLTNLFSSHGISEISVDYQGFFTPVFAQVILYPQCIFVPLSRLSIVLDTIISYLPRIIKKLSFNIVITGRFPEK
jgi:ubiquinone/menaquinone biosynthesis C-methylase UbiE